MAKRRVFLDSGKARWLDLDPDDSVRLLALDELLQAGRSGDVTNARGEAVGEQAVVDWAKATLGVPSWRVIAELMVPLGEATRDPHDDEGPASVGSGEQSLATLRRLRIASVDRLVREVVRAQPQATRASVLSELESAGPRVRWFGRSIVCMRDAS